MQIPIKGLNTHYAIAGKRWALPMPQSRLQEVAGAGYSVHTDCKYAVLKARKEFLQ
jgi:hypothetical protein